MTDEVRGPQIHRAAPVAVWKFDHRWGSSLGDVTTYTVSRTLNGTLRISVGGKESLEIRADVVAALAEMVAAADAWTDYVGEEAVHASRDGAKP